MTRKTPQTRSQGREPKQSTPWLALTIAAIAIGHGTAWLMDVNGKLEPLATGKSAELEAITAPPMGEEWTPEDQRELERLEDDLRLEEPKPKPSSSADPRTLAHAAARAVGIDPHIYWGLIMAESGGCKNLLSHAGAIGCAQLMPSTARELGVNPHDMRENILGGAMYLAQQDARFGDMSIALSGYNLGPNAMQRWMDRGGHPDQLPEETRQYVTKVMLYAALDRRKEQQLAMND